jgi:hypothetical protein
MVSKVASKDGFDKGLHGVKFEADGSTVGSNGRVIMVVTPAERDRAKFPPEAGDEYEMGSEGLLMPIEAVDKAVKNISRDKRMAYQYVGLMEVKDVGRVGFTAIDEMGNPTTYAARPKREGYPEWRDMLVGLRGDIKLCVNRRDLIDLLGAMEAACPAKGDVNPVFIELKGDGSGLMLRCVNYDTGQHAIGGIGKYDTRGQWLEMNWWEKALFKIKKVVKRRRKK